MSNRVVSPPAEDFRDSQQSRERDSESALASPSLIGGKRRQAYVDAAREAFFERGYGDTTMSSIACAAGGSKSTLWLCFPSKEALFAAVVDDSIERYGEVLQVGLPLDEDVEQVLRRFATVLMTTVMSGPILSLYRLVVGEAQRFPHLATLFYERGPRGGRARLTEYTAAMMARGRIVPGDPATAVQQFVGLCQAGVFQHMLFGMTIDDSRLGQDIESALQTFGAAWFAAD